jgi:acyl-coenzyme A thioesterase PaaI-like protein
MFRRHTPRIHSPRRLRWILNLYPPLLFQAVRVVDLRNDFMGCTVRVRPSWRTRNLAGTTFGGTIYSAADPMYAVLFWQILAHRGVEVQAWLRAARALYVRPAASTLTMRFEIRPDEVEEAQRALAEEGRWAHWHRIEAHDRNGDLCAVVETETYLRIPRREQREVSGF